MLSTDSISDLRELVGKWKHAGERVALVPTMGNFHEGHLSLIKKATEVADRVVVSLFVNPLQFNRQQDLDTYPVTLKSDIASLKNINVDCLFNPSVQEVYPNSLTSMTRVSVASFNETLEGEYRPDHLQGVATVVLKLFNMVQPDISIFGEKDFQQYLMVNKMVKDLDLQMEVIAHPTVRESDGLAMSSRNNNLTIKDRKKAPEIYKTLQHVASGLKQSGKKVDFTKIQLEARNQLEKKGFKVDYLNICSAKTLKPATGNDSNIVILVAAWLDKVRLIDNLQISL